MFDITTLIKFIVSLIHYFSSLIIDFMYITCMACVLSDKATYLVIIFYSEHVSLIL